MTTTKQLTGRTNNQHVESALRANDYDAREAYKSLASKIGYSLIYSYRGNGQNIPRPIGSEVDPYRKSTDPTGSRKSDDTEYAQISGLTHEIRTQHEQCLRHCYAIARNLAGERRERDRRNREERERAEEIRGRNEDVPEVPAAETAPEAPSETPDETPEAPAEGESLRERAEILKERLIALQEFVNGRKIADMQSYRPFIDGVKLLNQGWPIDAVLASVAAAFSDDTRAQANVKPFDFAAWGQAQDDYTPEEHAAFPAVKRAIAAGVNTWLYGPAGTGKSQLAKRAARELGLPYYEINLAQAMASAIKGKLIGLDKFVRSQMSVAYETGGICCLEELDRCHPSVIVALNNALANGEWHNDAESEEVNGELVAKTIKRHPNFRCVATANSLAQGATTEYTSAMKLDDSTLDRFRAARIYIGQDRTLLDSILDALVTELEAEGAPGME